MGQKIGLLECLRVVIVPRPPSVLLAVWESGLGGGEERGGEVVSSAARDEAEIVQGCLRVERVCTMFVE